MTAPWPPTVMREEAVSLGLLLSQAEIDGTAIAACKRFCLTDGAGEQWYVNGNSPTKILQFLALADKHKDVEYGSMGKVMHATSPKRLLALRTCRRELRDYRRVFWEDPKRPARMGRDYISLEEWLKEKGCEIPSFD